MIYTNVTKGIHTRCNTNHSYSSVATSGQNPTLCFGGNKTQMQGRHQKPPSRVYKAPLIALVILR